jgi:uncharacterized protein YukJ
MKILKADFHFALPHDFNGNLADALRLLADFVEQEQAPRDTRVACFGSSWQQFYHNLRTALCRFTGKTSLMHLPDGQPWQKMPQSIVCAHHDESGAAWLK